MMKLFSVLGSPLLLLLSCGNLLESNESTTHAGRLFPLRAGQTWTYRITEADMDINRIGFPKKFTVSVVGQVIVKNKTYYRVANYLVPGPTLPDTILVRNAGDKVYLRFGPEEDEYMFYLFSPGDTTWSVPMYVNPNTTYPYYGSLGNSTGISVTLHWGLFKNPDRGESHWIETFQQGYGRTRIVSASQAFGKVVWRLENT